MNKQRKFSSFSHIFLVLIRIIPYISYRKHTKFSFSFSFARQLVFLIFMLLVSCCYYSRESWRLSSSSAHSDFKDAESTQLRGSKAMELRDLRTSEPEKRENSHFHMRVLYINIISAFSTFSHFAPLSRLRSFQIYFLLFFIHLDVVVLCRSS